MSKSDSASSSVSGSHITAKMMPPVSHVKHKTEKCASMRMGACRIDEDCSALCGPIKLFLSQNKRPQAYRRSYSNHLTWSSHTKVCSPCTRIAWMAVLNNCSHPRLVSLR